ncbi:MAG TPA: glucose-6-phosphate isomerase [Legionellales bacterium]|nr:glucose-6-phosphate isomerase [Legionellales bacterium]
MIKNLDALDIWKNLHHIKNSMAFSAYKTHFKNEFFEITFAHNHVNQEVFQQLFDLPRVQLLQDHLKNWSQGEFNARIQPNFTFLRNFTDIKHPYFQNVLIGRQKVKETVEKIRSGQWKGYSGQAITDIVNIGIGGSDLGPRMTAEALEPFQDTALRFHFMSDADPYAKSKILKQLNPATSLFLVSSKSFSTEETIQNALDVFDWMGHPDGFKHHFIAITANPEKAQKHGFVNILPIWDWVIGRYSCCSAINSILALMIGYDAFEDFLKGAHHMDLHFFNTPIKENIPMLMALLGIWNINFLDIKSHLLLIYDFRLRHFVDYVQQMDMESNGKSVNHHHDKINYATGPIIWGGLGNQAHHSYYQLLAQGKHRLAIDFMTTSENDDTLINQLCRSRIETLKNGIATPSFQEEIQPQAALTHIHLNDLTPKALGALIAMYEHKVFTQAWLWNINPFDQPGVESAKRHA